jgi:hypothetical protein|tara:strand:+ start:164 stop:331 length:168 start_codon:yes stop_codon:yes gene_type:complete
MDLNFIIKDLEHTINYFDNPRTEVQIGRKFQAEKTLQQIKLLNNNNKPLIDKQMT